MSDDPDQTGMRPQEWIAVALAGFFDREGRTMPDEQKAILAAMMGLAATGIQGDLDVDLFHRTVFEFKREMRERSEREQRERGDG